MLYVCLRPENGSAKGSCDLFLSSSLRFSVLRCRLWTQLWWSEAEFPVTCDLNLIMYESGMAFALAAVTMGAGSLLFSRTGEAEAIAASAKPMTLFMMAASVVSLMQLTTTDALQWV